MSIPAHARCVVIGCGIVGNSLAYHLTRLGWRDIVLLDKGPLPNPGGSTGHASNFIYLVDHSKEMTALTVESVRQYREMGVFIQSGGVEVAVLPFEGRVLGAGGVQVDAGASQQLHPELLCRCGLRHAPGLGDRVL